MERRTAENRDDGPEERLLQILQEGLSHRERLEAARELHQEGENLEAILKIYPEFDEELKRKQAI